MKGLRIGKVVAVCAVMAGAAGSARAEDSFMDGKRVIAGVDIGLVKPVNAYSKFSNAGGVFSPFAGFMFNDYIGLMGQAQFVATEGTHPGDKDTTAILGASAGPRVALPMRGAEIYATFQSGYFTGLSAPSAVTDTSWGFSTGGGVNIPITDCLSGGVFGRFNRLYQRSHGVGDVQYATGGISLTMNFGKKKDAPAPPPPAEPVAAAPVAEEVAVKQKIVLRGVNFDFDKSNIRADARPVLDEAVSTLKTNGDIAIVAEGHTDAVGSDAYNEKLSDRRANSVKNYLVDGGIDAARIDAVGMGETKPVASNETDDGRAQNRRVELRVK